MVLTALAGCVVPVELQTDPPDLRLDLGVLREHNLEVLDGEGLHVDVLAGAHRGASGHVVDEVDVIKEIALVQDGGHLRLVVLVQHFDLKKTAESVFC